VASLLALSGLSISMKVFRFKMRSVPSSVNECITSVTRDWQLLLLDRDASGLACEHYSPPLVTGMEEMCAGADGTADCLVS
jgi:hypothetical protein